MSKVIEIDINETLQYIKDGNNSPQRIMALCSDLFPKNHKDRNFLNMAVVSGIAERIRKTPDVDSFKRRAYISELINDYGMQAEFVEEIIDCWINVYTPIEKIVEKENILLNDKIAELSEKLAKECEKLQRFKIEVHNLENENNRMKIEINNLKYDNKLITLERDNFKNIYNNLLEENKLLKEKNKNYLEKLQEERKKSAQLEQEIITLRTEFDKYKNRNEISGDSASLLKCKEIDFLGVSIISCDKRAIKIDIPKWLNGQTVKCVGEKAFSDCSSLTQVTIPSTVTSIEEEAFSGCTSLTQVTIPSSVTFIGKCAFAFCRSLLEVIIPSSVIFIRECAFEGCTSLTQVTIPRSVTSIGRGVFGGCSKLISIKLPKRFRDRNDLGIKSGTIITYY